MRQNNEELVEEVRVVMNFRRPLKHETREAFTAFDQVKEPVLLFDKDKHVVYQNPGFSSLEPSLKLRFFNAIHFSGQEVSIDTDEKHWPRKVSVIPVGNFYCAVVQDQKQSDQAQILSENFGAEAKGNTVDWLKNSEEMFHDLKVRQHQFLSSHPQDALFALIQIEMDSHPAQVQELLEDFAEEIWAMGHTADLTYCLEEFQFAKLFEQADPLLCQNFKEDLHQIIKRIHRKFSYEFKVNIGCARFSEVDGEIDNLIDLAKERLNR